jgi:zinc transport system substrate-binding protein
MGRWRLVADGAVALLGLAMLISCRPAPESGSPATASAPSPATSDADASAITVFVSILPQAQFVERIGGTHVKVDVLVGPGESPHSYEPSTSQMQALGKAKLFFRIGVPFEDGLLPKVESTFKQLDVVDTRQGITLRQMESGEEEAEEHEHDRGHEHEHEHEHGGSDPHIWLSPRLVAVQAGTIADALCRIDPAHADEYRANLAAFRTELAELDARLAEVMAPLKGQEILVFHPAFGYFTDAYGLRQVPAEIEGKEPAAKDLAALIKRARERHVRVIFVQPQFSTRSAEALAQAIGGSVVALDPLARDYVDSMMTLARTVREALQQP